MDADPAAPAAESVLSEMFGLVREAKDILESDQPIQNYETLERALYAAAILAHDADRERTDRHLARNIDGRILLQRYGSDRFYAIPSTRGLALAKRIYLAAVIVSRLKDKNNLSNLSMPEFNAAWRPAEEQDQRLANTGDLGWRFYLEEADSAAKYEFDTYNVMHPDEDHLSEIYIALAHNSATTHAASETDLRVACSIILGPALKWIKVRTQRADQSNLWGRCYTQHMVEE